MSDDAYRIASAIAANTEQLHRIADLLEILALPEMVESDGACSHPTEQRVDFSAPGVEEFHCKACNTRVSRILAPHGAN